MPPKAKYFEKKCKTCNKSFITCRKERKNYCSKECLDSRVKKHSEETKKLLSEKRKNYLKNNLDKHPWKNNSKFRSTPCENVKQILSKNNIKFISEWQPLENRFYSIDIAFPDIKFGIEINGNQHYNRDGTLKNYYQKRHDIISKSGWKLIELHYSNCFNEEKILNLIDSKTQPDYTKYFQQQEKRKLEYYKKYKRRTRDAYLEQRKKDFEEKQKPKIKAILESDINFSKFGWVTKASKILNISPSKVNVWMKKYMPEFYKEKCFVRNCKKTN